MRQAWAEDSGGSYGGGGGYGGIAFPSLTPVVKRLLIANFAIWVGLFFLSLVAQGLLETRILTGDGVFKTGILPIFGLEPLNWFKGFPFVYPWQVVTYGFLHSPGGIWHILSNSIGLYFFGTMIEGALGSRRFLGFYLLSLVVAGIASALFKIAMGSTAGTVGASGAVFAIICAAATMRPTATVIFWFFPLPLMWVAIGLVGINLVPFLQEVFTGANSGIDHVAHLAGAGFGFLAVRRGFIWRDLYSEVERHRDQREKQSRVQDERKLDDLLQRIHEKGIQDLSEREKAFLKRMSKRG